MPDGETPFVALDLPFPCNVRDAAAAARGDRPSSPLVDNYFGGPEALMNATLHARPRRITGRAYFGRVRTFDGGVQSQSQSQSQAQQAPPTPTAATVSGESEMVRTRIDPLQPIEMAALAPHHAPRDRLRSDSRSMTRAPVYRGDVTASHDLLLKVRRPKRGREGKTTVTVVGEIVRRVDFVTPPDPCFLPDAAAVPASKGRDGLGSRACVRLPPHLAAAASRLRPTEQVEAGLRRSLAHPPAAFLSELAPGAVRYSFHDDTVYRSTTVRSIDIEGKGTEEIPSTAHPTAVAYLERLGGRNAEICRELLAEQAVWSMPELKERLLARGLPQGDRNLNVIRALTYRVVGGPMDRLLFRLGFDYRDAAHRDEVAPKQRFALRIPGTRRRFFKEVSTAPDITTVLQSLVPEEGSEDGAGGSSHQRWSWGAVAVFTEVITRAGTFIVLSVEELRGEATTADALQRGALDTFDAKSGWFSAEASRRATMLFGEALFDFIDNAVVPKLSVAPAAAPVAEASQQPAARPQQPRSSAEALLGSWEHELSQYPPRRNPRQHGASQAQGEASAADAWSNTSEDEDDTGHGDSDDDAFAYFATQSGGGGTDSNSFGDGGAAPTAAVGAAPEEPSSAGGGDLLGDWDVGGYL